MSTPTLSLIPIPVRVTPRPGAFTLAASTPIEAPDALRAQAEVLRDQLRPATGFPLPIVTNASGPRIALALDDRLAHLGDEGYRLAAGADAVAIASARPAGLLHGMQTLRQLLPPAIFRRAVAGNVAWSVPGVEIEDAPRFSWRGSHLDVGRHFMPKTTVLKHIDLLALHKLNVFHWHLTDDQGWRIEIKRYPRLTEVGAWRKRIGFGLDPKAGSAYGPDGRYGGYYTQADIRELVAYAASRHITIVPEIEMPGHAGAALAACPQFSCFGGPYSTDGGTLPGVYCAGKDETFEFLQNVLTEVCQLFPGKYIHIGGDEVSPENWKKCPKCQAREVQEGLKTEHELESYFIRRIEKFLNSQGRTLVGWSEIREGGLAQNATIMDWIGGAVESAREGHDVIMTPAEYCYLDYYQSTNNQTAEPKAIGGYLPLKQVYAFEPVPAKLEPQFRS